MVNDKRKKVISVTVIAVVCVGFIAAKFYYLDLILLGFLCIYYLRCKKSNRFKPIALGQTIKKSEMEFTLTKVQMAKEIKPENPPLYHTVFAAEKGSIYICLSAAVKNTDRKYIQCSDIYSISARCGGKLYRGFNVITDSKGDFETIIPIFTVIDPFQTQTIHSFIQCPQGACGRKISLIIEFKDGSEYRYSFK